MGTLISYLYRLPFPHLLLFTIEFCCDEGALQRRWGVIVASLGAGLRCMAWDFTFESSRRKSHVLFQRWAIEASMWACGISLGPQVPR